MIGLVALVALVVAGIRVVFRPTTPAVEPAQPHVVVSTPQPERR
ncbi:hypothetical protein [Herbidospora cretacea]|nr:hypothetical protein [Herbidospora cretacea]